MTTLFDLEQLLIEILEEYTVNSFKQNCDKVSSALMNKYYDTKMKINFIKESDENESLEKNLSDYYSDNFEDGVDAATIYYEMYGNFDNFMGV